MVAVMKASEFSLTSAERAQLAKLAAGEGRSADRARIVLACSEPGVVYARLADELRVSVMTVHNVRHRFAATRLAGLTVGFPPNRGGLLLGRDRLVGGQVLVVDRAQHMGAAVPSAVVVELVAPGQHDRSGLVGIE